MAEEKAKKKAAAKKLEEMEARRKQQEEEARRLRRLQQVRCRAAWASGRRWGRWALPEPLGAAGHTPLGWLNSGGSCGLSSEED